MTNVNTKKCKDTISIEKERERTVHYGYDETKGRKIKKEKNSSDKKRDNIRHKGTE